MGHSDDGDGGRLSGWIVGWASPITPGVLSQARQTVG
jgi:hypothetical protein